MSRYFFRSLPIMTSSDLQFQTSEAEPQFDIWGTKAILCPVLISLLRWISNFGGSNTLVDFDPVLALRSSTANLASNPARFLDVFSVSFTFGFGFGVLVQKCTVFEYVF